MAYGFERFVLLDDTAVLNGVEIGDPKSVQLALDVDPQTDQMTVTARVAFSMNPANLVPAVEIKLRHLKKFGAGELRPEVCLQLFDLLRSLKQKQNVKDWVPLVQTFQLVRTKGSRAVAHAKTGSMVKAALRLDLDVQPGQRFKSAAMVRLLDQAQAFVVQTGSGQSGKLLLEFRYARPPEFFMLDDVTALKTAAHPNLHFISNMAFAARFLPLIR